MIMNKVKTPRSDSYQDYLIESLKDPEDAAAYIEAILEAADPEPQLPGSTIVLLLCGGDKSTQQQDIRKAKEYWTDYEKRESADQR